MSDNVFYDEANDCNVCIVKNITIGAEKLAKQLHEVAVSEGLAVESDWTQRNYHAALVNEAMVKLKEDKRSDRPELENHFLIILEGYY